MGATEAMRQLIKVTDQLGRGIITEDEFLTKTIEIIAEYDLENAEVG